MVTTQRRRTGATKLPKKRQNQHGKNTSNRGRRRSSLMSNMCSICNPLFSMGLGMLLYKHYLDPNPFNEALVYYTSSKFLYKAMDCFNIYRQQQPTTGSNNETKMDPTKVVFYHVHDANTAGSSLNRYMARKYFSVCGHKGYSYDQPLHVTDTPRISSKDGGFGPDRVKWDVMEELGWHNCQFISNEVNVNTTIRIIQYLQQQLQFYVHVLVPCRDPISHRLSKCSYLHANLHDWVSQLSNNNNNNAVDELCSNIIHRCPIGDDRYSSDIITLANQTSYFWYSNFTQIDDIVHGYLPQRWLPLPDYDKVYQTTTQRYSNDIIRQVIKHCGYKIHQHYHRYHLVYKHCSQHVVEVNQLRQR